MATAYLGLGSNVGDRARFIAAALARLEAAGVAIEARSSLYETDAVADEPPDLVVPHPRLLRRPFVRIPLAEVAAPGLVHPLTGEPLDRASPAASVRLL